MQLFTVKYTNNQLVMIKITAYAVVQNLCKSSAQQKTALTIPKTRFLSQLCNLCKLLGIFKCLVQLVQKTQDNNFKLYIYYILIRLKICTTAQMLGNLLIFIKLHLCKTCTTHAQLNNYA